MRFRHPSKSPKDEQDQTDKNATRKLDIGESSHGKQARIWVIAHCIIQNNVIVREWLVRDNKSLFQQLGVDWAEVAKSWAKKWYQETENFQRNKSDSTSEKLLQSDWLKSEYKRVSQCKLEDRSMSIPVDVCNITADDSRSNCCKLGQYLVEAYIRCWVTISTNCGEFEKLYHPHARFESPLCKDSVGPSDILKTYRENFYFNPKQSQNVKMSADWVILRPETWTEIKHNSSAKSMKNKWIYPFDSDVACLQQLFGTQQLDSTNQNRDEKGVNKTLVNQIPEKYTMSIRWTMAGDCLEQTETGQMSIPVVIIGESYLHCVGVRIKREIQVWDAVGVQAQIELGKMHQHGQSK